MSSHIFLSVGIISILTVFVLPSNATLGWHLLLIYPVVGLGVSFILLFAVSDTRIPLQKFVVGRILVYLGRISYGLYIYHIGCLILGIDVSTWIFHLRPSEVNGYYPLVLAISFGLDVLISSISYFLIEIRFLKLKTRFSD